jgi:GNAT superfamily N-acetyltransferase
MGDHVPVGRYPYALCLATPGDFDKVLGLRREAAGWLATSKDTDQWARPWPDPTGLLQGIMHDLRKGKAWLVWDDATVAATITIDTEEPYYSNGQPIWPANKRYEPALYVRRVIVSRDYAGLGLGAALLDWAAEVGGRNHRAKVIRVDVWTNNRDLHAYYERQHFTRCAGRDPAELGDYPSQALFERAVDEPRSDYRQLLEAGRGAALVPHLHHIFEDGLICR